MYINIKKILVKAYSANLFLIKDGIGYSVTKHTPCVQRRGKVECPRVYSKRGFNFCAPYELSKEITSYISCNDSCPLEKDK